MAEEFTMPKLGLTMTDGTIREWLVADGTEVRAGDPVLIIETDKVETEVEARTDGVLRVTGVVGATYECGAVIGYLFDESSAEDIPDPATTIDGATPGLMAVPDVEEPTLNLFGDHESAPQPEPEPAPETVASQPGDGVSAEDRLAAAIAAAESEPLPVAEHLSDEAVAAEMDAGEPEAGGAEVDTADTSASEDETIDVDPVVVAIVEPLEPAASIEPVEPAASIESVGLVEELATRGVNGRILASPRARATAGDVGIDLAHVAGTGPGGRILHDDVIGAIAARTEAERLEAERIEAERLEAERAEAERLEAERAEAERQEAERLRSLPPPPEPPLIAEPPPVEAQQADEAPSRPLPRAAVQALNESTDEAPTGTTVAATAGARLLADFLGVDLAEIDTHPGGRITREDVGAWVRERLASTRSGVANDLAAPTPFSTAAAEPEPTLNVPLLQEPAEIIPLRGMRGLIAERMHASLTDMAQLTLSVDVDMTGINAERERRRSAGHQVPGYTAWVVAASAQAIESHGYVNSQITNDGIAVLPDVHVGVAVALDEGLIVPVIEHANLRTVEETHAVVADLAGRARNGKLQFNELEGATFSVTALGMFGVDMFTPVINPPNTAILGVGRLRSETGWRDGQPVEKTVMTLSLTWDHRAFDGAPAAEFAQTIVRLLEEPTELV